MKEFKKIVQKIENLAPKSLMIRDFQARNILVNDQDEVFFIDYQAAMEGPALYDVVSFLFQAKANFSENISIEKANELAKKYGQLAFVFGYKNNKAALIYTK